jgi:hypothetical protein
VLWLEVSAGRVVTIQGIESARASEGILTVHVPAEIGDTMPHCVDEPTRDRRGYVVAVGHNLAEARRRAQAAALACRIRTQAFG